MTTNNLFRSECFQAAVDNALNALPALVDAGVDGVFLDGVIPYVLLASHFAVFKRHSRFGFPCLSFHKVVTENRLYTRAYKVYIFHLIIY